MLVSAAAAKQPSGINTRPVNSFASTVSRSDTGSDLQNRMLRSRRSAYRQSAR